MSPTSFPPSSPKQHSPNIKVLGVGGGGCNALNHLKEAGIPGVALIALDTDRQQLQVSEANLTFLLGPEDCLKPEDCGKMENYDPDFSNQGEMLFAVLDGTEVALIVAGMGGGTATRGAAKLALEARKLGALTIALVFTPFPWEGNRRGMLAQEGLEALRGTAHTCIEINQEKLQSPFPEGGTFAEAYRPAEEILIQGVRTLVGILREPDHAHGEFSQARLRLLSGGPARIGTGHGHGVQGLVDALRMALNCPLLKAPDETDGEVILAIMSRSNLAESDELAAVWGATSRHYRGRAKINFCLLQDLRMEDQTLVTILEFA